MTSKERAKLKAIAANEDTIFQIGKNPLSDAFVKQVRDALAARELIKIKVLETCEMLPAEFAQAVAEEAGCEVVQVIGGKVVLFKRRSKSDDKPSLLDSSTRAEEKGKNAKTQNAKSSEKKPLNGGYGKGVTYGKKKAEYAPKPYQPKVGRIRSIQKNKRKQG